MAAWAALAIAAALCSRISVLDSGPRYGKAGHPGHMGHKRVSHDLRLANSLIAYAVRYCACVDDVHKPYVVPLEGYIGMPLPSAANWYHSGFMAIFVDGQDIGRWRPKDVSAAAFEDRAIAQMVFQPDSQRIVWVKFMLLEGRKYLACQIRIRWSSGPKSVRLRLTCYPSFFTAWHRREGRRVVIVPGGRVVEGERKKFEAGQAWWAFYCDEVFDPARGEGDGPCAMLILPEQLSQAEFRPTGYPVETVLDCRGTELRLAFWDFKGLSNAEALEQLRASVQRVADELRRAEFRAPAVSSFDVAAARAELVQLRGRVGRSKLAERLAKLLDEIGAAQKAASEWDWQAERRAVELVQQYRELLWDLKIDALFAGQ